MTITEHGASHVATRLSEPVQPIGPVGPLVLDTTELRWFLPGALPADVRGWFTGSTGFVEERCDAYLLDDRGDIGVKRRCKETLELKVRQSLGGQIEFGEGLAGSLEVWRRWSPADGFIEDGVDGQWVDVRKSIVKRRFLIDGTEIAFSPVSETTRAGCDVEIAGITVGAVDSWTFAFAAFGPPATRREALLASWQALMAAPSCPESFRPRTGRAMGYPEWLASASAVESDTAQGSRERRHTRDDASPRKPRTISI